jgi:hypothetical protein
MARQDLTTQVRVATLAHGLRVPAEDGLQRTPVLGQILIEFADGSRVLRGQPLPILIQDGGAAGLRGIGIDQVIVDVDARAIEPRRRRSSRPSRRSSSLRKAALPDWICFNVWSARMAIETIRKSRALNPIHRTSRGEPGSCGGWGVWAGVKFQSNAVWGMVTVFR